MQLPPVLADGNLLALVGKLFAGGGVGAALFLVARVMFKARALATVAWLGGIFSLFLAALALSGVVDVNPGRLVELGRLGWELGNWVRRTFGVGI